MEQKIIKRHQLYEWPVIPLTLFFIKNQQQQPGTIFKLNRVHLLNPILVSSSPFRSSFGLFALFLLIEKWLFLRSQELLFCFKAKSAHIMPPSKCIMWKYACVYAGVNCAAMKDNNNNNNSSSHVRANIQATRIDTRRKWQTWRNCKRQRGPNANKKCLVCVVR